MALRARERCFQSVKSIQVDAEVSEADRLMSAAFFFQLFRLSALQGPVTIDYRATHLLDINSSSVMSW